MGEVTDAITGFRDLEKERADILLVAARRIAWVVGLSQGMKIKEKDIIPLDLDDEMRKAEIEKYGYATVTKLE